MMPSDFSANSGDKLERIVARSRSAPTSRQIVAKTRRGSDRRPILSDFSAPRAQTPAFHFPTASLELQQVTKYPSPILGKVLGYRDVQGFRTSRLPPMCTMRGRGRGLSSGTAPRRAGIVTLEQRPRMAYPYGMRTRAMTTPALGLTVLLLAGCTGATPVPDGLPAGAEALSFLGEPLFAPEPAPEVRERLEAQLAEARSAYERSPMDAEAIIWLGRRLAYLGRYREAIDVFGRGIQLHPGDARFYRHRGHRWITVRELDRAVADLAHAAELIRGQPDEIEPDGMPNPYGIPTSTLQSNIWYHLGLAHYLAHEFERALPSWREALAVSTNDDMFVATTDWLYMTLRRLGREAEAEAVLEPVRADMRGPDRVHVRGRPLDRARHGRHGGAPHGAPRPGAVRGVLAGRPLHRVHRPVRRRRAGLRGAVVRRRAAAAHVLPGARPAGRALGLRPPGLRLDAGRQRILFRSFRDSWTMPAARLYTVAAAGGPAEALPMPVAAPARSRRRPAASSTRRSSATSAREALRGRDQANRLVIFDLASPGGEHPGEGARAARCHVDRQHGLLQLRRRRHVQPLRPRHARPARRGRSRSSTTVGRPLAERRPVHRPDRLRDGRRAARARHAHRPGPPPSIHVPTTASHTRPSRVAVGNQVSGFALSPKGERALFTARGDIFTAPIENGPTRNLTNSSVPRQARALVAGRLGASSSSRTARARRSCG
jgi:hypothetical protein